MCEPSAPVARTRTLIDCAAMLAIVVKVETGVEITPEQVIKLIKRRWGSISDLAHNIHRKI